MVDNHFFSIFIIADIIHIDPYSLGSEDDVYPCPKHTDTGIMTFIPIASTSGLQGRISFPMN